MSHLEHERFMEDWYENNYDEQIPRYVEEEAPEINEQFDEEIDPSIPGHKRFEAFIAWFKARPEHVKGYEAWLVEQIPDGPDGEFDKD